MFCILYSTFQTAGFLQPHDGRIARTVTVWIRSGVVDVQAEATVVPTWPGNEGPRLLGVSEDN